VHHKFLPLLFSLALLSGCYYSEHNPDNIQPPQIIVAKDQNLNAASPANPPAKKPSVKPAAKTDGPPLKDIDVTNIPDAIPKKEPLSAYGNPSAYTVFGKEYHVLKSAKDYNKTGIASWYGSKFHGMETSTREIYDLRGMTAASTELPLPTYVRVTDLENGKQVVVKVNDRGPFEKSRVIDLSYAAAKKLGYIDKGTALVRVEAINPEDRDNPIEAQTQPVKTPPKIYLQVGSFSQSGNADQFKVQIAELTKKPVRIVTFNEANHTFYRVQIGPLADVSENDKLEQILRTKKLGKPITVVE
jgi:rare lipoprotein A